MSIKTFSLYNLTFLFVHVVSIILAQHYVVKRTFYGVKIWFLNTIMNIVKILLGLEKIIKTITLITTITGALCGPGPCLDTFYKIL